MIVVNSQQARELDHQSEQCGVSTAQLMENAGKCVAEALMRRIHHKEGPVAVFVGKGNNGGDALVAANALALKKFQILLIQNENDFHSKKKELEQTSWILDGLLGTGLKGEVKGWMREAIEWINASGKKVLSIDIPSGLSADKGIPLGVAVRATVTVALGFVKLGSVLSPGLEFSGAVECADIGIPKDAKVSLPYHLLEPLYFKKNIKPRSNESHKKDFGHVVVIAGSEKMPGSGFLSSMGALRTGAGLVTYVVPKTGFEKFDPQYAEVMLAPVPAEQEGCFGQESVEAVLKLCENRQAVVLGPGLGQSSQTKAFVKALLPRLKIPVVLDADGLNAIALDTALLKERPAPTVLTPHPGEMASLLGWATDEIQKARVQVALDAAFLWQCAVVLKGFRSLIATPDGRLFVNPTGNPGMATAGMGDVLSGMIAGLIAQGWSADAASMGGVYLHGLAGDMAREEMGEKGLIASDVLGYVPKAIRLVEGLS
ncbi:MAG: NAD(P)H-hydrate dehydratase [Deltaproteobacteria bacterium]|nr:NAD(P)H-hydrate dehydratase [Deltaproteobacteria bacterium]